MKIILLRFLLRVPIRARALPSINCRTRIPLRADARRAVSRRALFYSVFACAQNVEGLSRVIRARCPFEKGPIAFSYTVRSPSSSFLPYHRVPFSTFYEPLPSLCASRNFHEGIRPAFYPTDSLKFKCLTL